ncbi:MAG TPA: SDR family NAD(P)-dependent oxidoreductase, partial [Ensifer sp.]|nr:SDR family NAD(P)-dependent oxidoreductase [Ensifer sp.]
MADRLKNKRIIVIGAATGIGRAAAAHAIAEGARVVIGDFAAEAGAKAAQELGPNCHFVRCDISDEASVKALFADAIAFLGGLDGLINNAGLQKAGPVETFSVTDWDSLMGVNARGVFLATREAIPH